MQDKATSCDVGFKEDKKSHLMDTACSLLSDITGEWKGFKDQKNSKVHK